MYCTIGCAASPSSVAAPDGPVVDRLAVDDDEAAEAFRNAKHAIRNFAAVDEIRQHHVGREFLGLAELGLAGQHRAAEVERGPVADRVIDHVPVRPAPECRIGLLQILRHLGGGDGGAEDDGAGRQRIAVADDALSHVRIDAVGADQARRRRCARRSRASTDDAGSVQLEAGHAAVGAQLDQFVARGRRRAAGRGYGRDARPHKDCRSAARSAAPQGMLATSSPVTPSIIRSRSIISAFFFAAAPTPSASSTDSALGATWRPTPTSPNSRACSSTSERKPFRASASAQASPPMPPPAIATGWVLRVLSSCPDRHLSPLAGRGRRSRSEPGEGAAQRTQSLRFPYTPTLSPQRGEAARAAR